MKSGMVERPVQTSCGVKVRCDGSRVICRLCVPGFVDGGEVDRVYCAHLIQALNECHAKGVWHKITGGCNGIKHDLNMCLRQERVERTANHVRESRESRKKTEQIWKEIDQES
ncbi:hypothetical protein PHSY_003775 [Pseudozyma hubeiensis SY62]|uniref:COX assembly mitochondrial protein n=1 Tax=Pseudozyma hubeiensis (strain SY62) TaxID=1305764 RepID=R9PDM1_PSEHS|nr:hypothetical protein PHSY_003775 [Pseudozyma hubeiensis SY62]GAC96195.1 hypothetical protein PHSY_003775 [Pseudozyma hubeiensis SY62]